MSCHHCRRRRHFQRPTFQKCNRHFRMVKEAITIFIVCHLINVLCCVGMRLPCSIYFIIIYFSSS